MEAMRTSTKLIPYSLQIDLRENDLAKAIVEFTSHYSEVKKPSHRRIISTDYFRVQNVILKGYNMEYDSFGQLMARANAFSRAEYGCRFNRARLFECPNLIMVFYTQLLVDLALRKKGLSLDAL